MIKLITLSLITLVTTGCQQAHCPRITHTTHDCMALQIPPPQTIPIKNEANARLPERTKAYAVNRYIDPSNPRIMHERHIMYRIEDDPKWRLATDETRQILIGNTLTNSKLNYNPAILQKELALELQRQRLINEALQSQSEMLIDTGAALSQDNAIMQERSEQLRKALESQKKIIEDLKDRLDLS